MATGAHWRGRGKHERAQAPSSPFLSNLTHDFGKTERGIHDGCIGNPMALKKSSKNTVDLAHLPGPYLTINKI